MEIGERIAARLAQLGLRQADIARTLSISPQRFGQYVKGVRKPDDAMLARIAVALQTDPTSLGGAASVVQASMRDILLRLFELDGMPKARAETLATIAIEAARLSSGIPDDGDARTRARTAAQIAWQIENEKAPN